MAIAASRNKRIRVYGLVDGKSTAAAGRMKTTYAFQDDYWGAFRVLSAKEQLVGTQGEQVSLGMLTVLDSVPMPDRALIRVSLGNTDRYFRVIGLPRDLGAAQSVQFGCQYVDDDTFTLTGEPD